MYVENQSDKYLTVGGINVLGDMTSPILKKIENEVQDTFDKTQTLAAQQKEYWSELSNDNVITPVEKKQIKQELSIIEKTYSSVIKKAEEFKQEFNPLVTAYATAYRKLKDYINDLNLFDYMSKSTKVDKADFNTYFSDYYEYEAIVQSVFLEKDSYKIRVLNNLTAEGEDGEVAIYRNGFYRWNGEKWELVGGGSYLGCFDYIPEANIDDFFLVRADFTGHIKYKVNGKFLKSNGKFLVSSKQFKKGFIYKLGAKSWEIIELKSDHRYFLATEDLLEIGEPLSTHLQKWFTDVNANFEKYEGRLIKVDTDLDGIYETFKIVDKKLEGTTEDIEKVNGEILRIDTDLDGIEEQFLVVNGTLVELQNETNTIQGTITKIDENLDGIIDETTVKFEGYDESFTLIEDRLDGDEEVLEELNGKIVNVEGDLYTVINGTLVDIRDDITNLQEEMGHKIEVIPKYQGGVKSEPEIKFKGDWFTWEAESNQTYTKGQVYMWNGEMWQELDPTDSTTHQYFMSALTDILKTNATGAGYFSTVFASALIASNAFIENLQSQVITLTQALNEQGQAIDGTGVIQSENYLRTQGAEGWQIKADGTADFKHVSLDYIKSANAEFTDSKFSGELDCGTLQVKTIKTEVLEKTFSTFSTTTATSHEREAEYLSIFNVNSDYQGDISTYVTSLFGTERRCVANNKNVVQLRLYKYKTNSNKNNYTNVYAIYEDGTNERIYYSYKEQGLGSYNYKATQTIEMKVYFDKGLSKQLLLENLESSEPTTKNVLWAGSDGILRIKK